MCIRDRYGTVQTVAALTPTDVTAAWKTLLKTARVCLSFLGMESDGILEEAFQAYGRTQPVSCQTQVIEKAKQFKEVTDRLPVNQAKLVMGFRTGTACLLYTSFVNVNFTPVILVFQVHFRHANRRFCAKFVNAV